MKKPAILKEELKQCKLQKKFRSTPIWRASKLCTPE